MQWGTRNKDLQYSGRFNFDAANQDDFTVDGSMLTEHVCGNDSVFLGADEAPGFSVPLDAQSRDREFFAVTILTDLNRSHSLADLG